MKLKSHNQHFWATVKSNELLLIIAFYYKYTVADFDFQITSALIECECALIFTCCQLCLCACVEQQIIHLKYTIHT